MKEKIKLFFKKRLVEPIRGQLLQGATPQGLALTVAVGVTVAVFPILGATTALCLLIGILCKLNQPVLQAINYLLYPLQILLLPAFLNWGSSLMGAPPISFVPSVIVHEFTENPRMFLQQYGMAGLHAVLVWLIIAPWLGWMLYQMSLRVFSKWRTA